MKLARILEFLNPSIEIGGIEIDEASIKFAVFGKRGLLRLEVLLPAGALENGKVKQAEILVAALKDLRRQIGGGKKKIFIIASIPDVNVYTQIFNLPAVADKALDEAAVLNLQIISPLKFSEAYYDWQKVGREKSDGEQYNILGAFIQKKIIDDFNDCLLSAGFVSAAFEFPGLGMSRLVADYLAERGVASQSAIGLRINPSGMAFCLVRNTNLYFHHFEPWEKERMSVPELKTAILRETQKVLNFFSGHWEGQPDNIFIASPDEKISALAAEALQNAAPVAPVFFQFPKGFPEGSTGAWIGALASAARGKIPRSVDTIISLASTGTEQAFKEEQTLRFIALWRNIIGSSCFFVFAAMLGLSFFFSANLKRLRAQAINLSTLPETMEVESLQSQAREFNLNVAAAFAARQQLFYWSPIIEKVINLAGSIVVDRITAQGTELPIMVSARAASESEIVNFKNKISEDGFFTNVDLPLSNIVPDFNNMLSFNVSFVLSPVARTQK